MTNSLITHQVTKENRTKNFISWLWENSKWLVCHEDNSATNRWWNILSIRRMMHLLFNAFCPGLKTLNMRGMQPVLLIVVISKQLYNSIAIATSTILSKNPSLNGWCGSKFRSFGEARGQRRYIINAQSLARVVYICSMMTVSLRGNATERVRRQRLRVDSDSKSKSDTENERLEVDSRIFPNFMFNDW